MAYRLALALILVMGLLNLARGPCLANAQAAVAAKTTLTTIANHPATCVDAPHLAVVQNNTIACSPATLPDSAQIDDFPTRASMASPSPTCSAPCTTTVPWAAAFTSVYLNGGASKASR